MFCKKVDGPAPPAPPTPPPFGVSVLGAADGSEATLLEVDLGAREVVAAGRRAPLLPAGASEVAIHAIIDHSILEVIFNNQTAFTLKLAPSTNASELAGLVVGGGKDVQASLDMWRLSSANNLPGAPAPHAA